MVRDTTKATQKFVYNKKIEREHKKRELFKFIRDNPGETAYSITKKTKLRLTSVQELLKELEEDLEIKIETITDNNRIKRIVRAMTLYDLTYDYFLFANMQNPKIKDRVIKQAKMTQEKGIDIQIEMEDGQVVILSPDQPIEKFIQQDSTIETLEELELYMT